MIAIQLAGGNWFAEFWESFLRQLAERFQIGDIGEEINHGILQWQHTFFDIQSIPVVLTDAIIVTWIAVIAMIILLSCMVGKDPCCNGSHRDHLRYRYIDQVHWV